MTKKYVAGVFFLMECGENEGFSTALEAIKEAIKRIRE